MEDRAAVGRSDGDDRVLEFRRGRDDALELTLFKTKDRRRLFGNNARGSRLSCEQRQLSERVASLQAIEHFPAIALLNDLRASASQNIESVSGFTLTNDRLARRIIFDLHGTQQAAYLLRRERRKDRAEFQEVAGGDVRVGIVEIIA